MKIVDISQNILNKEAPWTPKGGGCSLSTTPHGTRGLLYLK